jgi:hypothetical protein
LIAADGSQQDLAVDASTGEIMKVVGQSDDNGDESGEGGDSDQN